MANRLLVKCRSCQRQYSLANRMQGKQFHCHCGVVIKVKAARGHDATVVVCSACGAPRQENARSCTHCDSDFTLHEQDLVSMCPGCLSRISKRARFCHHCGLRIEPESVRVRKAVQVCPACEGDKHLAHRMLGTPRVAVLECQVCAGLWIPLERFCALIEGESTSMYSALGPGEAEWKEQSGRMYRPCAVCRQLMIRQHFGRGKSRVILDICGSHGVWLDNDELAHLLAWVRAGGARDAAHDIAKLRNAKDRQRKREAFQLDEASSPLGGKPIEFAQHAWLFERRSRGIVASVLQWMFAGD